MRMTSKTKRTCTGGRHMALDIFRFGVFFLRVLVIVEGYYLAYGPHIGPAIKWKGLA